LFFERIYFKRFKKEKPDKVLPLEEIYRAKRLKKAEKKKQKQESRLKHDAIEIADDERGSAS